MTILANELEALGKRGDMGLLFRKLYNNLDTIISALRFMDAMYQQKEVKDGERTTSTKSYSGRASGKRSSHRSGAAEPRAVSSVTEE